MWDDLARAIFKYGGDAASVANLAKSTEKVSAIAREVGVSEDLVQGLLQVGAKNVDELKTFLASAKESDDILRTAATLGKGQDEFAALVKAAHAQGGEGTARLFAAFADDAPIPAMTNRSAVPEIPTRPTYKVSEELPVIGGPAEPGRPARMAMRPDGSPGTHPATASAVGETTDASKAHTWVNQKHNNALPDDASQLKKIEAEIPTRRKALEGGLDDLRAKKTANTDAIDAAKAKRNQAERTAQAEIDSLNAELAKLNGTTPLVGPNGQAFGKTAADIQAEIAQAHKTLATKTQKLDDEIADLTRHNRAVDDSIERLKESNVKLDRLETRLEDVAAKRSAHAGEETLSGSEKSRIGKSMQAAENSLDDAVQKAYKAHKSSKQALDQTAENFPNYRDRSLTYKPSNAEKRHYHSLFDKDKGKYVNERVGEFLEQIGNEVAVHRVQRSNQALEELASRVDLHNALINSGESGLFVSKSGGLIDETIDIGTGAVNNRDFSGLYSVTRGVSTENINPGFTLIDGLSKETIAAVKAEKPLTAAMKAEIDSLPDEVFRRKDVFPDGGGGGGNAARYTENAADDMRILLEGGIINRGLGQAGLATKEAGLWMANPINWFRGTAAVARGAATTVSTTYKVVMGTIKVGVLGAVGYASGLVIDTFNPVREEGNWFDKVTFGHFDKRLTEEDILKKHAGTPPPATGAETETEAETPPAGGNGRASFGTPEEEAPATPPAGGGGRGSFGAPEEEAPATPPAGGGGRGSFGAPEEEAPATPPAGGGGRGSFGATGSETGNNAAIAKTGKATETISAKEALDKADPKVRNGFTELAKTNTTSPENFTKATESGIEEPSGGRHV